MRENCTYGSMRGSRRKTAKSVLRVVEDRAGVPYGGVPLYSTPRRICRDWCGGSEAVERKSERMDTAYSPRLHELSATASRILLRVVESEL